MNKKSIKSACGIASFVVLGAGVINLIFDVIDVLLGRREGPWYSVLWPYGVLFYLIPAVILFLVFVLIRPDPEEEADDATEALLSGDEKLIEKANETSRARAAEKKAARAAKSLRK